MRCVLAKRAGAFGDRLLHTLDDIKGVDDFETVGCLHKASEDIICDKVNNVKKKNQIIELRTNWGAFILDNAAYQIIHLF
jgi:hypothetical protein